jgi:N-acyl-phosphatidylethanolamine-hydrolysing phospholipase D
MAASTAAVLYASVISSSQIAGAVPEDAKDKQHHLKDGKGFQNPWPSFRDASAPHILWAMLKYVLTNPLPLNSPANAICIDAV